MDGWVLQQSHKSVSAADVYDDDHDVRGSFLSTATALSSPSSAIRVYIDFPSTGGLLVISAGLSTTYTAYRPYTWSSPESGERAN